ncbi:MarR family winged helix-turn-helix transcriptional regulator [Desulforapulum autotrophicum]|uniref:MarR family winged helix-turn-helix transcriptional regulator n=1 Tax=Desulforapulum autotrophicum TaxID=2296 RepID=UPI0002E07E67|nr:MarR family transcriptional regulator [Desulforapulum autotrophicum]
MEQNRTDSLPEMKAFLPKFKAFLPEQDVEFMMKFADTMLMLHRVVVVSDAYFQRMGTAKGRVLILTRLLLSDASSGDSISDLRPFYPISYAAMSGVLDTLEKDGMVERCANPEDRRRVNIRLSEKGRKFIIDFLPTHVENVKKISSGLQEDEVAQMFGSLEKIIGGFERLAQSLPEKNSTASGGGKADEEK